MSTGIKNLRKDLGWSQQEFGDLTGVGRYWVSSVETGRIYSTDVSKLDKVAAAVGITLDALLVRLNVTARDAETKDLSKDLAEAQAALVAINRLPDELREPLSKMFVMVCRLLATAEEATLADLTGERVGRPTVGKVRKAHRRRPATAPRLSGQPTQ